MMLVGPLRSRPPCSLTFVACLVPVTHRRNASRLSFQQIDAKWQKRWTEVVAQDHLQRPRKKSYVLPMFAYPSGSLHMGHLRVYTISDVIARYRKLKGYDVLHPTGWDSFGLPAENAAIERDIDPAEWTKDNIKKMKTQLKSMNTDFNWNAEISTCSPSFYKHTQKLFLMLFKTGLAYQAEALVNYDPIDKTVLANEQVDAQGRSWRSGALVQQINLRQWFFRIKAFQDDLLQHLDFLSLDNRWPERVVTQQRNWLGRSRGAKIQFTLVLEQGNLSSIDVFTTRADTLFGVTYLALSLSHPLVEELASSNTKLRAFLDKKASYTSDSKAGFELPIKARNPFSSTENKTIPVFAAPYVLDGYGEGAVMGVPAHDSRDLAFWKLHRPQEAIPIAVVSELCESRSNHILPGSLNEAFVDEGFLTELCGKYAGFTSKEAREKIALDLAAIGRGQVQEMWRLRDWLVSRQRYWGTPIPIVHCNGCGSVPVPEDDLPILLPKLPPSLQIQTGNPLEKISEWVNCECPQCHQPARRETDTMDTFVDSSWYYTRFPDSGNEQEPFSKEIASSMLPVDIYVGGVEHAILHLLYARFIYKFLCSQELIPNHAPEQEPFQRLIAQGMVHGKTFSDPETGRFLLPHEVDETGSQPVIAATGVKANISWEKMSKSKHNGIAPSTCIEKYGADATRAHILFSAPVSEVLQWDEQAIVGVQRWFGRIQELAQSLTQRIPHVHMNAHDLQEQDIDNITEQNADVLLAAQATIQSVTKKFEDVYSLNTAISDLMKLTNLLHDMGLKTLHDKIAVWTVSALLRMLAPIAPAFAEQCWEDANLQHSTQTSRVFEASWPQEPLSPNAEAALTASRQRINCAVQVNGKFRFTVPIPAGTEREAEIVQTVLASEKGRFWLTEKNDWSKRRKVIVVGSGKVLNVVF